jgi:hypothetical protein
VASLGPCVIIGLYISLPRGDALLGICGRLVPHDPGGSPIPSLVKPRGAYAEAPDSPRERWAQGDLSTIVGNRGRKARLRLV